MKIHRIVGFDANGLALGAGCAMCVNPLVVTLKVIALPTDHYDFVGYDVRGKTAEQIERETQ